MNNTPKTAIASFEEAVDLKTFQNRAKNFTEDKTLKTIVVYHHPCTDGLTAAAAAYLKLGDSATYIKHSLERKRDYLDELLPLIADQNNLIYFLDCAPIISELPLFGNNKIIILDHHLSNQDDYTRYMSENIIPDNISIRFDMEKSGAGMAWEHFHPKEFVPMMISYVQDRDLWKFKYESTKAFGLGLMLVEESLKNYAEIIADAYKVMDCVKNGAIIEKYVDKRIFNACKHNVKMRKFAGFNAIMINSTENVSDVGVKALEIYPTADFAAIYQHLPQENKYKVSLRSRKDTTMDVSQIASRYNGGGHRNASACVMTVEQFMEIFN